jgi:acetyltransferase-like isoleucine patch superfamily enzyme
LFLKVRQKPMRPHIDNTSNVSAEVQVDPTAWIGPNCHLSGRITIGPEARLVGGVTLIGELEVGRGACIEPGVCVGAMHPGSDHQPAVRIGHGAHIGAGAILAAGISVGHGAWVGPGTVVSRHVPPHAVVSGNPATITGYVNDHAGGHLPSVVAARQATDSHPVVVACQVPGVALHHFKHVRDLRGDLTVGEFERTVPFSPKRYFVVFDVPSSETRGEHAHKQCHQFLVCVGGTVSIVVDDGYQREEILLDRPSLGLFIPAGIWGIQYKYSPNGTLLVFASEFYDPADYIRDYDEFLRFRNVNA